MAHRDIFGTQQAKSSGEAPEVLNPRVLVYLLFGGTDPSLGNLSRSVSNLEHAGKLSRDQGLALLRLFETNPSEAIDQISIALTSMASAQIASESKGRGKGANARA